MLAISSPVRIRRGQSANATGGSPPAPAPPADLDSVQEKVVEESPILRDVLRSVDFRSALSAAARSPLPATRYKRSWLMGRLQRIAVTVLIDVEKLRLLCHREGTERTKEILLANVMSVKPALEKATSIIPKASRKLGIEVNCRGASFPLRLTFESHNHFQLLTRALIYGIGKALIRRRQSGAVQHQLLVRLFREADTDKSGSMQLEETFVLLDRLGVAFQPAYVAGLFHSLSPDNSNALELDEFLKLLHILLTEKNLSQCFDILDDQHLSIVPAEKVMTFFSRDLESRKEEVAKAAFQGMGMPFVSLPGHNHHVQPLRSVGTTLRGRRFNAGPLLSPAPSHPSSSAAGRVRRRSKRKAGEPPVPDAAVDKNLIYMDGAGVTVYGLCRYMLSPANSICNPDKWGRVYLDMGLPLTHYWIRTSLSPLDTNVRSRLDRIPLDASTRLTLKSACEDVATRLQQLEYLLNHVNVRALLFKLTKSAIYGVGAETFDGPLVPWESVLDTLARSAFRSNPYPVVLLLDFSGLGSTQTAKSVWNVIIGTLGRDNVYYTNNVSNEAEQPQQQRGLSIQRVPALDALKNKFVLLETPPTEPSSNSDSLPKGVPVDDLILVDQLYRSGGAGDLRARDTEMVLRSQLSSAGDVMTPGHHKSVLSKPVSTARLITSAADVSTFAGTGAVACWSWPAVRHVAADTQLRAKALAVNRHNFSLVLPSGGSGKALVEEHPSPAWSIGINFVPLSDLPTVPRGAAGWPRIMEAARFQLNGNVGYVTKPKVLLDSAAYELHPTLDIEVELWSIRQVPLLLHSCRFQELQHISLRLMVGIDGVIDGVSKVQEYQHAVVRTNGLSVDLGKRRMSWSRVTPNVSTLTVAVDVRDAGLTTFVRTAYAAVPITCARSGHRCISLLDPTGSHEIPWSKILVKYTTHQSVKGRGLPIVVDTGGYTTETPMAKSPTMHGGRRFSLRNRLTLHPNRPNATPRSEEG